MGQHQRGAEALLRVFAGGVAHRVKPGAILEQADGPCGHCVDVADGKEQAGYAVIDQLGYAADAGCDGGNLAGHGLKRGQAEGFKLAGHHHQVGQRKKLVDAILLAQEMDAVLDAEVVRQPLGGGAVGPVADQDQLRGNFARHLREDLDHVDDALDGPEVRQVNQDGFVGAGKFGSRLSCALLVAKGV